ncbi:MAG: hypothetical protein QXO70_00315 [Candidatus Pacearchaeota archaeon]
MKIGTDPIRTPILYADSVFITTDDNGLILDIAQRITGTDQAFIVARVGLSKEHAKKLATLIADNLAKSGEFFTSKVKLAS